MRSSNCSHGGATGCGVATRSCVTPAASVETSEITTVEAIGATEPGARVQKAWLDVEVVQCGYCQSGQIMAAAALLATNPNPSDADIDDAMSGNVCRCGTHPRIRVADLNGIPPEYIVILRLDLVDGTTLLRSAYPIDRIWRACQPGADAQQVDLTAGGVSLLAMRQGDEAVLAVLDSAEARFVRRIIRGACLGKAAQLAGEGVRLI